MTPTISQNTLKRVNRWKFAGLIAVVTCSVIALLAVENLLVSSLIAFIISYSVGPLVNWLERHGIGRTTATVLTFIITGLALTGLGAWLFPYLGDTFSAAKNDVPRYISRMAQMINETEQKMHALSGPLGDFDLSGRIETQLNSWAHDFFDKVPSLVKTFFTVMVLGPFLSFFMVKDGRAASNGLLGLVPNQLFEPALSMFHQINFQIGQFVRARMLESLIVGMVTTIGLLCISFPYAVFLGVIAGVTNLIPYVGPIMGAVPAFMIALVNGHSNLGLFLVALVYVIAQLIDAGFLIPLMVAKIVDLHPVTVIIVVIVGSQVGGILGMIICIPVATTLKVTINSVYRYLIDTRT